MVRDGAWGWGLEIALKNSQLVGRYVPDTRKALGLHLQHHMNQATRSSTEDVKAGLGL